MKLNQMKVMKITSKEMKGVSAQCCCRITGKPAVYESGSCCLADCSQWFGGNTAVNTVYH